MLKIVFGEAENVFYGPSWFKFNYEIEWFQDELVQQMLRDVDKTRYVEGHLLESDVLGAIAPEALSGGVKTLISIYNNPDMIFDATSCGQNCAKWLIEIGKRLDVTVNLKYLMRFGEFEPFEIYICNQKKMISTNKEYIETAIQYV